MYKIGIVGCGAIGSEVVKAIKKGMLKNFKVVALLDLDKEKAKKLSEILGEDVVVSNIDELLSKNPDIVIEAASPIALKQVSEKVLKAGKTLVTMSSGAFLDKEFYNKVLGILNSGSGKLLIPSGAIGGVDILKALSNIGADVKLTTVKSISAFKKAKNLDKLGIDLNNIKTRTLVFKGKASEAIQYFPTMLNVSATISLAIGKDIEVEMYADPTIHYTLHIIEINSEATDAKIILDNKHHPENPKTSYLAPLSLIKLLQRLDENIIVGT